MSFEKRLECSRFLSSLTTLAWVVLTCQAHVCMQRAATAHPVVNIFCKSKLLCMSLRNEAMARSGATSGVVWPCRFVRIG